MVFSMSNEKGMLEISWALQRVAICLQATWRMVGVCRFRSRAISDRLRSELHAIDADIAGRTSGAGEPLVKAADEAPTATLHHIFVNALENSINVWSNMCGVNGPCSMAHGASSCQRVLQHVPSTRLFSRALVR